jgi:hypothetical protein
MIYKVTVKDSHKKVKAVVKSGVIMARRLDELLDVDLSGAKDNYILTYDSTTQKYKAVNPDEILSSAVSDTESPGLPSNFKNQLDIDLDDRIDLDGGSF